MENFGQRLNMANIEECRERPKGNASCVINIGANEYRSSLIDFVVHFK